MDIRRTARLLALGFLGLGASAALAAADGSQLALPPGATVAIVVFEDLQCPDCARAHPGLLAASKAEQRTAGDPRFPRLPGTPGRFRQPCWPATSLRSRRGWEDEFRSFIFESRRHHARQPAAVRGAVRRAARSCNCPPTSIPDGKLQAQVQADFDLGKQIHLEYVPLMFVLGPGLGTANFVEVMDPAEIADVVARARKATSP